MQWPGVEHGLELSVSLMLQPFKRVYRVREIVQETGVSKAHLFGLLKRGELDGRKLGGVLLITGDSYRQWLESAIPWKPKRIDR